MRRPTYQLPPGTCDTHVHVWGPFDRFPVAKGAPYTPPERNKADLLALHARLGVDRCVIVQTSVYKADNRAMLDAIADNPSTYRGVALVDETFGDAEYQVATLTPDSFPQMAGTRGGLIEAFTNGRLALMLDKVA